MKKLLLTGLFSFLSLLIFGQGVQVPINLPYHDNKPVHWGFTFGVAKTDFTIYKNSNFFNTDSVNILGIEQSSLPGLFLGPVFNVRLGKYFDFRFLIDISFTQRNFTYYFASDGDSSSNFTTELIKLPSSFVEVPLLLKYKGQRCNNFRPYMILGASPKFDLAALRKINYDEPYLQINPVDVYLEVGPGFDFYFPYFKFSVELKYSNGFMNNLYQDHSKYSTPIDALKSHSFMLSFHFEG